MIADHAEVSSPCIRCCCLADDDICLGCFRSLEEILHWSESNADTRHMILRQTKQRRQAYNLRRVHSGDLTIQGNDQ